NASIARFTFQVPHIIAGNTRNRGIQTPSPCESSISFIRQQSPLWSPVGGACGPFIDEPVFPGDPRRATIKALPSPLRHPRPYGCLLGDRKGSPYTSDARNER
ncbi:MAG TPA: hypothetical protein VIY29_25320, partial [Ktedonobacteraceae bacterium]